MVKADVLTFFIYILITLTIKDIAKTVKFIKGLLRDHEKNLTQKRSKNNEQ